jgi:phosphoglycerate dehydrogenase-like enzyme
MRYGILADLTERSVERGVLGPGAEIECFECRAGWELPDRVGALDAVMVWHLLQVDADVVRRLRVCRVIVRVGAGYDNVDLAAAGAAGIPVVTIPDYGTNDVADHAMALLLALCRRLPVYLDALRLDPVGAWQPEVAGEVSRLTGSTLGIIGLGRIGSAMAVRAKSFGLRVAFYDPYLPDGFEKSLQVERVNSLEELVASSDYLSIHAPLTAETRGMVNGELLKRVKPGLTLINVARGGIVSLNAVAEALADGRLRAFGADVLESEPPRPDHPLISAFRARDPQLDGRILLTPHAAFFATESRIEMRTKSAQRMLDAIRGIPLRNCVNSKYLRDARVPILPSPPPPWGP